MRMIKIAAPAIIMKRAESGSCVLCYPYVEL